RCWMRGSPTMRPIRTRAGPGSRSRPISGSDWPPADDAGHRPAAANADVQEASDWYEGRELGLGGRFLDELRDTFARIRLMPLQFPTVGKRWSTDSARG